ncbi:MAG: hypothetical protein ABIR36_11975, partial [Nitrospiraceae bacterium]
MEVDDVEITVEHRSELCRFYSRLACLLGNQRGQYPEGTAQTMHHNPVLLDLSSWLFPASQVEGVFAMHDLNMVSFRYQRASQCLHENGIPAKMVRGIKCGDHTKTHQISLRGISPDDQGAALRHLGHPIVKPLLQSNRDE